MKLTYPILILILLSSFSLEAQVFSNREVGEKHREKIDSIKQKEYPYILPIWGKKAAALGFTLPLSAGVSVNYLWQESDIVIENLEVGFSGGQKFPLDEIVQFNDAVASTNAVNIRPDVWVFPFLNVYGIIASSKTSTAVDVSVVVPDSTTSSELFSISTVAEFQAVTTGFGLTPTIGIGGGFMALDMNFTWTDIEALSDPAFSFVFGPRFGKSFKFREEGRSLAAWVGGFRVHINSGTDGSLPIRELFPGDEIDERLDGARENLVMRQENLDAWYGALGPVEQKLYEPVYNRATDLIGKANQLVNGLENSLNTGTIDYSLDKRQKNMWNFIIGAQYQHNPRWMFRAEFGFLTARTQFIGGIQYRFGL